MNHRLSITQIQSYQKFDALVMYAFLFLAETCSTPNIMTFSPKIHQDASF